MNFTDPALWFRGKQLENARVRIAAADWELFTARPHDPDLYPNSKSAHHCGWHGQACGVDPVWAVMVPLRSANRVSMCSLATIEAVTHYTARLGQAVELCFEGALPDEASVKIAEAIVKLRNQHNLNWVEISEVFNIEQQRTRRLYDFVEGPEAHKEPTPTRGAVA